MKRLAILVLLSACAADEGGLAPGERMVTGRIRVSDDGGTSTRRALQLVALYTAPECTAGYRISDEACAVFGKPFDPGMQGGGVVSEPARLVVPCDLTVNLLVQTIGSSEGLSLGEALAVLEFPGGAGAPTTLLACEPGCRDTPRLATNVLDLGTFTVSLAPEDEVPVLAVGGPGGGTDPLATVDTDQDLTPNAADDDDDGDGSPDLDDTDDDGNGVPDLAESFSDSWLP